MKTRLLVVATAVLLLLAGSAHAQTTVVRVVRPQSTIWNPAFTTVAAVVPAGTELTVVGRQGMWYQVLLPFPDGTRQTGFIAISQVEIVSGTPPPAAPARPPAAGAPPRRPQNASSRPVRPGPLAPAVGLRGFGQVGYGWTNAHDSFDALFGSSWWLWYGGGAHYTFGNGLFVQGSGDLFRRSGSRVFVIDDEVFDLGIHTTMTMLPLTGTVGYRFSGRRMSPYIGGGAGLYLYREDFEFAESGEGVNEQFPSYHALGGIEFRHSPRLGSAIEVQYTYVTNDFTGLADVFDEHNLGGLQVRGKLLFGGR